MPSMAPAPSPAPSPAFPKDGLFNGSASDLSTAMTPGLSALSVAGVGTLADSKVHHGSHCDTGCIIGAVIGSVAAVIVLLVLSVLIWMYCRRRRLGNRSTASSQMDLMEDSISSAQGLKLSHQHFEAGDRVFCRDSDLSGGCPVGTVISSAGDNLYKVRFEDGVIHVLRNSHMAPHFQSDASVKYMPPDGKEGISCTVITADGSYWPPFYHLRPDNSSLDSINTTAEHLLTNGKQVTEYFGSDIVARAV